MNRRKILAQKIVKTKTQHTCYGCGRKFPKNSEMISMSCSINGSIVRRYLCNSCQYVTRVRNISIDNFWYGDLLVEAIKYEE